MKNNNDKKLLINIGQHIRQLRVTKKMPQQELAQLVQSQKATMSRVETGRTNLKVYSLYKIAAALDVEIAVLMENVDDTSHFARNESMLKLREKFDQHSSRLFDMNMEFRGIMVELNMQKDYLKRKELHGRARELLELIGKINQHISTLTKGMHK